MRMKFTDKTCKDFIDDLASNTPLPGSSGVSALVAAAGVAISMMIANLTAGSENYAQIEPDIKKLLEKAQQIKTDLLKLVDDAAASFRPLIRAHSMPIEDPSRLQIMEDALKSAGTVSIEVMRNCAGAIDICSSLSKMGNRMAACDTGSSAIFCKSALQAAALNVFANTKYMDSRSLAKKLESEARELLGKYCLLADEIYDKATVKFVHKQIII